MSDTFHPLDIRMRAMLRSGKRLRGLFNGIPSPALVEMSAFAGFDFLVIDNEHGSADLESTENMLRAARASGIATVVRCLMHDIPRVLDIGAGALQIPMINNADEARDLVNRIKYPLPGGLGGTRGSAFSGRAAGYGAFGGPSHTQRSNEGIALIAMIETPEGWRTPKRSRRYPAWTRCLSAPTIWRTPWALKTAGMKRRYKLRLKKP